MATTSHHERCAEEGGPTMDPVRAEAEERAHDRLAPDTVLDAVQAVHLYVEAFQAGARFAVAQRGGGR